MTAVPRKAWNETRILGIETTCDETAAAVFTAEPKVLSTVVASQAGLHARFGGVVPELAARAHLDRLMPVIRSALDQAGTTFQELDAVAVARAPGLVGAILVGLTAAKTLSAALEIPLLTFHHVEAHLFACQMQRETPLFPCIGLVVSGGHTHLFDCIDTQQMQVIGATIDDAAGEAFDKVAALLKLGYPGGPLIEKAASAGNPRAFPFSRTFLNDDRLDFSFSGLKTAVRYAVYGQNAKDTSAPVSEKVAADVAASFQAAVVEVLVAKCRQACRQRHRRALCVGGGVAANGMLRRELEAMCRAEGIELVIPPLSLCTDNAAMAAIVTERFRQGDSDPLDLDAQPGLMR
jgi:N6-L-threonylcarbamoyladenine synthase